MTNKNTHLFLTALGSAIKAGRAILDIYESDFKVEYKEDRSPLTEADRRSHKIIIHNLTKIEGGPEVGAIPILSEEGKNVAFSVHRSWKTFWLVDPLDGTKEYLKRNGEFTVNIALIESSRPVMGVIFAPVLNVIYFAFHGLGSYRLGCDEAAKILAAQVMPGRRRAG